MPKNINIKCGIEIHKQVEGKKLFCSCPTIIRDDNPIFNVTRYIRTSAGESGRYDVAALYEAKKGKHFVYQGYNDTTCLVELDEKPPQEINQHALEIALQVCLLLNCKINSVVQVMRKIVIDGSNTSGFQRTMLIGFASKDSFIETTQGKVRITSLCLEEDACKIIKTGEDEVHYSLSRQGIPLLELRTEPDIKDPEQAKETAEQIGLILRSFSSILRGIGTIRQDVNLSIKNGSRVEIKGFQELREMPKIINYEIQRQINTVKQGKKVEKEVRKANDNGTTSFLRPLPGAARMYPDTDIAIVKVENELLNKVKIPELLTERITRLQKHYNLSYELAYQLVREKIDEEYFKRYNKINSGLLASLLINYNKDKKENIEFMLNALNSGKITKDVVDNIMLNLRMNKKVNLDNYKSVSYSEIEKEIKKIMKDKKDLSANAIMGILMNKYKGRVDGKKLIELVNKLSTK